MEVVRIQELAVTALQEMQAEIRYLPLSHQLAVVMAVRGTQLLQEHQVGQVADQQVTAQAAVVVLAVTVQTVQQHPMHQEPDQDRAE